MIKLKIIRWIFSILRAIEQANIPLLQLIPSRTKKKLVRRIYKPLTSTLPTSVELNGLSFYIPRELDYSYVLYEHEQETQQIIKRSLQKGMVAVDVGANIGYLTLIMAQLVGEQGKVYAVEPGPDNLELLYKNIQINGMRNVEVLPYAAGRERRKQELYLRKAGTLHSLYAQADAETTTVQVQVAPLNELIKAQKVDFIKLDVEGGEIAVLQGMTEILRSNPALRLIVEWNPSALQRAGYAPEELPDFLLQAGFRVSVINEESRRLQDWEQIFRQLRLGQLHDKVYMNLYAEPS